MTISSRDADRYDRGDDIDVSTLNRILQLIEGHTKTFRLTAGSVSVLGAILVVSAFAVVFVSPGRLTGLQYVATMVVGATLMLVGPLILGRAEAETTKLAANVVGRHDLRRWRDGND